MAAVQATMPDTVQIVYNLARREAEDTFLPTAQAANIRGHEDVQQVEENLNSGV